MFIRRLGKNDVILCPGGHSCPQFLEMDDKDIAVVGALITGAATKAMLPGPGVGPNEGVVKVPRAVMIEAARDILKIT